MMVAWHETDRLYSHWQALPAEMAVSVKGGNAPLRGVDDDPQSTNPRLGFLIDQR
jgi:hypothetical protein